MKVLLDTSFIISCINERIDFLSQLKEQGFQVIVPHEVFQELKDVKNKVSHESKISVDVAFDLFRKEKINKMTLGGRNVDEGLIKRGNEGYFIATLDSGIKSKVPKSVVLFKGKKSVGVEGE